MSVLVTHLAPDFTKPAVLPNGSFNEAFNFHTEISGKYAVLFFYPLGFYLRLPLGNHRPLSSGRRVSQTQCGSSRRVCGLPIHSLCLAEHPRG